MRKRVKGVAAVAVLLIAAATFAVGVGVGMWISGRDGGLGGEAVEADVLVSDSEEITETEAETVTTTEMFTTVQTAEYIEVLIDGDKYFYNGVYMDLDRFISEITKNGQKLNVRISFTDIATQYAYEELIKKLDENGIEHTESSV